MEHLDTLPQQTAESFAFETHNRNNSSISYSFLEFVTAKSLHDFKATASQKLVSGQHGTARRKAISCNPGPQHLWKGN